jgi:hypoxanthine phosphoribosyltransferase
MHQDVKQVLVNEEEIKEIAKTLGQRITNDYKDSEKPLVIIVILKGSMPFASDLIRHIDMPLEIEFMKVSSYGAGTKTSGEIKIHLDLNREHLENYNLLVVEDIVDSGRTLQRLTQLLRNRNANCVKTCTLLDKPSRREVDFVPDYCGRTIPDEFVVGYGLDYNEKYRNLPYVGILKSEVYS